jgi:hypothetical protein
MISRLRETPVDRYLFLTLQYSIYYKPHTQAVTAHHSPLARHRAFCFHDTNHNSGLATKPHRQFNWTNQGNTGIDTSSDTYPPGARLSHSPTALLRNHLTVALHSLCNAGVHNYA